MTGGWVRDVRWNSTVPAGEVKRAEVRLINSRLPSWIGFPQPGGGFPLYAIKRESRRDVGPIRLSDFRGARERRPFLVEVALRSHALEIAVRSVTSVTSVTSQCLRAILRDGFALRDG